jgi:protein-disulfide isomerase
MATRSKQKEEARTRRLAAEKERLEAARRQRRLRMLGGLVVGVVAVVAVAIAISSSNSSGGVQKGAKATQTVNEVEQLLAGIPQSGSVLGNPHAPVTLTYYGDLECPICQAFTLNGGFPQLVSNDVKSGKVKVVYRSLQTATRDPGTFQTQQVAALAAGQQQRFWNYAELFYRQQGEEGTGYVNDAFLTGLAKQIPGLNLSSWQSARSDQSLAAQVQSDVQSAARANINSTPTLIFTGPKGSAQVQVAVPNYSQLQQTLKAVE